MIGIELHIAPIVGRSEYLKMIAEKKKKETRMGVDNTVQGGFLEFTEREKQRLGDYLRVLSLLEREFLSVPEREAGESIKYTKEALQFREKLLFEMPR